jgi:hypothetical protein
MTDEALASATLPELHKLLSDREKELLSAKFRVGAVVEEITKRLADSAKAAFEQADKQHGTVNLPLQNGLTAKCEISKKVEWDSDKLMDVAKTMPWDRVVKLFKIAFAVPEKVYDGIDAVDPALRQKIDKARTVKYGSPKITLIKEGE